MRKSRGWVRRIYVSRKPNLPKSKPQNISRKNTIAVKIRSNADSLPPCFCLPQQFYRFQNGIAANEAVTYAKEQGMAVIVTDHHEVQEELPPADVIVDPKQDGETYPSPYSVSISKSNDAATVEIRPAALKQGPICFPMFTRVWLVLWRGG